MKPVLFLLSCAALVLSSCASHGDRFETRNVSLVRLQKLADYNLPAARDRVSRNGREFYSVPFKTKGGEFVRAKDAKSHKRAIIKVLGDSRPYTIEVIVFTEARTSGGQFKKLGYDKGLARVISRRIQKDLVKRRDDRNIIDDFKAF